MQAITLLELQQRVNCQILAGETQNVWITAELSDVALRGGHCYMELLQKDDRGLQVAKARGVIWARDYPAIDAEFFTATGQRFASGIKVMLRVSASMHPVYGYSLTIRDVDPDYTMGDLLRRRREILERLSAEGILEDNRQLEVPEMAQRVAVISAPGAAGYGDFINQLFSTPQRLRFAVKLFPAIMQGNSAPASIIDALGRVAEESDSWDLVVIIRGGGATSDLQAFEDYDLAANVAQFPLPVVIGIGHERDVTVLDYVAHTRVKTPTAAAEWLISRQLDCLGRISQTGNQILQAVSDCLTGCKEELARAETHLPSLATGVATAAAARLQAAALRLSGIGASRIAPALERLRAFGVQLGHAADRAIAIQRQALDSRAELLAVLSPEATLRRGYTITRHEGRAVTSAADLRPGDLLTTTYADGQSISTVQPT